MKSLIQILLGVLSFVSSFGVDAAVTEPLVVTQTGASSACFQELRALSGDELGAISRLRGQKYKLEHLQSLQAHALHAYVDHTFAENEIGSRTASMLIAGVNPDKLVGSGVYRAEGNAGNRAIFSSSTEFWLNYLTYLKQDPRFELLDEVSRYRFEDSLLAKAQNGEASSPGLELYIKKFRQERLLSVAKRSIIREGVVMKISDLAQEAFGKNHFGFFQMGNTFVPGTRPAFSVREFWPALKESLLADPEFQVLPAERKAASLEIIDKRISRWDSSE